LTSNNPVALGGGGGFVADPTVDPPLPNISATFKLSNAPLGTGGGALTTIPSNKFAFAVLDPPTLFRIFSSSLHPRLLRDTFSTMLIKLDAAGRGATATASAGTSRFTAAAVDVDVPWPGTLTGAALLLTEGFLPALLAPCPNTVGFPLPPPPAAGALAALPNDVFLDKLPPSDGCACASHPG
jgi:hypothetical protein